MTQKTTDFRLPKYASPYKYHIELKPNLEQKTFEGNVQIEINILEKNNSINSTYNGIAFTVDMIDDNPDKVRLFVLRSFGESLYHSITDSSLEFGYKAI